MANNRLKNYLRTFRRRSCLSQDDVAELLGSSSGTRISRYETFGRMPSVNTVFAYEIVFSQPARELFAGTYSAIHSGVQARAKLLLKRLAAQASLAQTPRTVRKLELLRSIVESSKPSSSERR